MKIIGYHYVRTYSYKYQNPNGIRFIDIKNFRKQLNFFKDNFYLPTLEEFLSFKKGIINLPKESIILTFDDGLTDHYNYVFPELIERKMWGIFFIPTRPFIQKKHIGTFALHYLLGKVSSNELLVETIKILTQSQRQIGIEMDKFNLKLHNLKTDSSRTLFLKKLINSKEFFKTEEKKDILIDQLLHLYLPEMDLYDIYLNPQQINEMENSGMSIAAHSITHNYMSDLDDEDQFKEISDSFNCLIEMTGKLKCKFFGFPYGKLNTINNQTFECLEKLNVDAAFLYNEPKLNLEYDNTNRFEKFKIPRIRPDYFEFGENYKY